MHRTFTLTVPATVTEPLCQQLERLPDVVGLSVQPGGSRKPAGDVLTLQVLNRGADEVLRLARAAVPADEQLSIATAEIASIIAPADKQRIKNDRDEAIWEEMIAGLCYSARINANYISLMALGGLLAAIGLVSDPVPQAVAFISSSIVAPGFEPLAKIPLGLVLRDWKLVGRGLISTLVGYAVFALAAFLTMHGLLAAEATTVADLVGNAEVESLRHPGLKELGVAGAGALAGILILAAYRRSIIAGPLIALALMPAAALIGSGLAIGQPALALQGVERTLADAGFIVVAGLLIFGLKQLFQHQRQPID
ncbi:DUF389 domain-containing protein [Hymenobacter sp. DH14]|uniref:DUF389 domain-containing protein n=1 Tax=Hymenobacter cyanobacteriorum TaxID=2926463 RepID=A0A9X1VKR8_9BACT|nr:DUF389 domain-containing protein [Hymenobacter cyanobacteriorum]MCI1190038.1 DUF389 domain-containing protein [Hymenobacter cyanobacteriorum]